MLKLLRRLFGFGAAPAAAPEPGYRSPPGYHRHRCSRCEIVWEHHNELAGYWMAHLCPECGHDDFESERGWPVYRGPLPPNHITRTP